jgi:AcrR family transcriptional regulator
MTNETQALLDRRSKRTQDLVFEAFSSLVQTKRYDTFRVADIIALAGIGRSTFYDHYANKDDVLLQAMQGPLSILVHAICVGNDPSRLHAILQHFWDRRAVARTILAPPMLNLIGHRFADMIAQFDYDAQPGEANKPSARTKMHSTHMAFGLFAVMESWLAGRVSMKHEELADWIIQLGQSHRALIKVMHSAS